MEVQFAKWGNSLAIRVPSKLVESLGVLPGTVADMDLRGDRLVITPRKHVYRLDDLLEAITNDNLHAEVPTRARVGKERID